MATGDIRVTPEHVVFRLPGGRDRTTSRRTIRQVVHDGRLVWIQRQNAHDWLVRCRSEADAERLEQMLRPGGHQVGGSVSQ